MKFHFGRLNLILLLAGIITVAAGYIIMSTGDKTLSPVLLIIAYVIIFPAAILIKSKNSDEI
ncbi:MAG: hypothetical protein JW996_05825 [Candidatus Cloacimonetes bacterium]|nr:hypothetical protein [Candidatus Cloacimonadota bacterium]